MKTMLLEKYEPKTLNDFAGNAKQVLAIAKWVKSWKKGTSLLIYGPSGVGKSLSAKLAAKEISYELVDSYASDARNASVIKETLLRAAKQRSMFYKGKLLVIDDAEALDSAKPIIDLVQKSEFPVIIIAGDAYSKNLRALRSYCTLVKFEKIRADVIENFLKKICIMENIKSDAKTIKRIAASSNGDLRAAVIDMESSCAENTRDYEENIFSVVRTIFKTKSIAAAKEISEKSSDDVVLWLEENIANEYRDIEDVAKAYDYLSKADLFRARISKRQSWSLEKFRSNLAVMGVAMSKKKVYLNGRYSPPYRFYNNEEILERIGSSLRISKKKARLYVTLIEALAKKNPAIAEKFGLGQKSSSDT